ncbi:LIMC1 protein, partial [Atractosteus spatula]|nr:LIMC1 protein [Atractosteus spatula]
SQDNLTLFLRGCEELGLKGTQLFDPGDLQDTSIRANLKGSDCSRKLKNVLITIYWLGKAANSCASYNGPTLDLKEFEGLLSQMRKEAEDTESPKRSIRDSGYIDCWDSERSDSLSPPRHGRDDSFDSLDSFGSRSRQTPSPDVVIRGSSDGRGSDSETDTPLRKIPDVRKDDMLARRTSYHEPRTVVPFNQYLPNKSNQSAYVPTPLRKKKAEREEYRKSWSTATSPIGGERPFSSSPKSSPISFCRSCAPRRTRRNGRGSKEPASKSSWTDSSKGQPGDDPSRRENALLPPQHRDSEEEAGSPATSPHVQRDDLAKRRAQRGPVPHKEPQAFVKASITQSDLEKWQRLTLCTDTRSVSMIDMRCEEEAILQPHSKARHEHLHNLHNKLKEEEDQWQDDLARWKSRRRSASQDLIKKEEERKMMERLMSGEGGLSERRKSIKTYREIVEEKERREKELHAAYRSARTPEEAEAVLQRYTQRFTISEAVLERLQLPRCLERSVSVDPSASSSSSSSSSGAMKYLRQQSLPAPKFTATVEASVSGVPQRRASSPQTSPTRAVAFKTVPLLTPKPYSQPRNSQSGLKSLKLDSLVRVNGETGEVFNRAEDERDSSPTKSLSSPTSPLVFESTTRLNPSPAMSRESPKPETAVAPPQDSVNEGPIQPTPLALTESHSPVADPRICSPLKTQESSAAQSTRTETPDDSTPSRPTSLPEVLPSLFSLSLCPLVQEKYQREQEKLKQEWEKAQREVEEEGRKYHEEELKILEETVAPLTPQSSTLSPPGCSDQPLQPLDPEGTVVRSLANWERKQELLEVGKPASPSRETITETIGKPSQENSQRLYPDSSQSAVSELQFTQEASWSSKQTLTKQPEDTWKKTASLDRNWNQQTMTGGVKRSGSFENLGLNPSKSSSCSSSPQPQSPNRSVSGKKLCSSCGHPLGKGAAMIIETLSLYFHIQCFKCGICKGQLGDTTTGTDVRIRNGLLNCNECYIRSRSECTPLLQRGLLCAVPPCPAEPELGFL